MLKKFFIGVGILVFLIVMSWRLLNNDTTGNFIENHPHPTITPNLLFNIGQFFFVVDNFEKSEQYYRKVVDNHPESKQYLKAKYMIIRSLESSHQVKKSKTEIEKFLYEHPNSKYKEILRRKLLY